MGPQAGTQFGGTEHMIGWLEYLARIPDCFVVTRGTARGNLSGTTLKGNSNVGQFEWSLRRFYRDNQWLKFCTEPNTATDRALINEVNLFIYVVVLALRLDLCVLNGFEYSALPLRADGTFNIAGYAGGPGPQPGWWAAHSAMLDGDGVIAAMQWECVRATPSGTDLENMRAPLQGASPVAPGWVWDSALCGLDPSSDRHTRTNNYRHEIWLPVVDLNTFPDPVRNAVDKWCRNDGKDTETMHAADWPTVASSPAIPQTFSTVFQVKRFRPETQGAEN